jgi:hypothetical protein
MASTDDVLVADSLAGGAERANRLLARDQVVAAQAVSRGTLIVEGDSWCDYPLFEDIVEALENEQGYRIRSAAHFGDTAESMAYDEKQLDRVRRLFKELQESGDPAQAPRGVLLSCGGNDIVNAFGVILNHRASGLEALNEPVVQGLLDLRLKAAIVSLVRSVFVFGAHYFPGSTFPVVLHGYGRPVPDGRGYPLGFGLVGPWLKPAFAARGHVSAEPQSDVELSANAALIASLIDRFNDRVLASIASEPAFAGRVKHVDLRPFFSNAVAGGAYQATWRDEIHATQPAYSKAAEAIHRAL